MVMKYKKGQVWEIRNSRNWTITIIDANDERIRYYWDSIPEMIGSIQIADLGMWSMKKRLDFNDYYEQL
jgi:hypothetical protein